MTRHLLSLAAAAVFMAAPGLAQSPNAVLVPTAGEPVVHVGLANRAADGEVRGGAYSSGDTVGDDLAGIVYLAPCGSSGASSNLRPPAAATDVWQLGGRIVSLDAEQAVVAVTWQRVRQAGQEVDEDTNAGRFQLRLGERQTLESISIPARGSCAERTASLDVAYTRRPVATRTAAGGLTSVRVGSGQASATGARGGSNASSGSNAGGGTSISASGEGAGVASTGVSGAGGAGSAPRSVSSRRPTVDLWLVQGRADGAERIHHLRTEVSVFPRAATFPHTTITTAQGTFTVSVECYVEEGLTPEGEPRLFISATRKVGFAPSTGPVRDRRPLVEGSIKTAIERPSADEVLEFELPAIEYPGAPPVADRLAIRLRLTPPVN